MSGERTTFDFVIVGAGSAGCVLADRLTRCGRFTVLLVEAGPPDRHMLIDMPKGYGRLMFNNRYVWHYRTAPIGRNEDGDLWHRGKTLGGSSSINGMMYAHGQPQDYDDWAAGGAVGWGWDAIGEAFRQIENHALGPGPHRGVGGPLNIDLPLRPNPMVDMLIAAGKRIGWTEKADMNEPEPGPGRIGYMPHTLHRGRRVSAARAFLDPARARPNLTIVTDTWAERLVVENTRVTGVVCRNSSGLVTYRANRDTILSLGTIHTPKLLQLSGIGPGSHLQSLGIEVIKDLPGVGANMREHRCAMMQYRLRRNFSHNSQLRGAGMIASVLRYALTRTGPMGQPSHPATAIFSSRPELARNDALLAFGPYSATLTDKGVAIEREPGMLILGHQLRPESRGTVMITAAEFEAPVAIEPNFLSSPMDQQVVVDLVGRVRALMAQDDVTREVAGELEPSRSMVTPVDIVTMVRDNGLTVQHAAGTCKIGGDESAVVDPRLRVHGIDGLRIMDCSVMPTLVSGNTNGPVMAMAWHAANLILKA